jgi:hypothetical protein
MRENIKSLKKNPGELEGGRVVALVTIGLYHMLTVLQKSVGPFEYRNTRGKRSDPHPVALLGLDGSYPASTAG